MKIQYYSTFIPLLRLQCILLLLVNGYILPGVQLQAQEPDNIQVEGLVTDEELNPIPGVTIVVEETEKGTITDVEGKFSITCPKDAQLRISFVGYQTETITASSEKPVEITLEPDLVGLEEVTVVGIGYGRMRRSDLTGSISSVSANEMKSGVVSSTEQLLQGRISGLSVIQGSGNPVHGASIRLRGGTSLTASNSPLIVVDGIPGVDINTVIPSEIESIDVLKDASASAIYGSRGANGVIIINTTKEKQGSVANYESYVAVGQVANHLDLLSANQWRQYVRDNNMTNAVDYGHNTDWQEELERTSVTQSHNLSYSNVKEDNGFRISLSYLNHEGVIQRSQLEKLGGSLSGHAYTLDGRLKLEMGLNTNVDKWNDIDDRIFWRAYNQNPTVPVKNEDGEFTSVAGTNTENPVEILTNRFDDDSRHRLLGYGKAELEIITGLTSTTHISYEYNSMQSRYYVPSNAVLTGRDAQGYGQRTLGDYTNMQLETYITYDLPLGKLHKANIMGGYSYLDNTYEGFGAERRGFDTDFFQYNNLAAGHDVRSGDVYSYKGNAKLISFFGRVNYSHQGRYMATATLRRDGSSRFGANHKWGLFPSGSVAWRISEEPFMTGTKSWLNNLKLRLGYGITGNQSGIGEYKSLAILGAGGAAYYDATNDIWKQSYTPVQNPNPELKWEETEQYNIGVDYQLFKRFWGALEVYQKNTSDLLFTYSVPQPPYLVGEMLANVGDLSNKGIEFSFNANLIKLGDFNWDMNMNLAHNKMVIENLSDQVYQTEVVHTGSLHGLRGMSGQTAQVVREGYAVGTFWGPKSSGLNEEGQYIDENGEVIDNNTEDQDLGNVQPKLNYGFGTSVSYKQFDLDMFAYGMWGQKVLNATGMSMSDPNRLPAQNVPDYFLEQEITADPLFSSYWVEDASFLRLQTVTLAYNFKIPNIGINRLRLYVTGENLLVLTNYRGVDPEVSIDGLEAPGIDMFNYYPKPLTISTGIKLTF